MSMRNPNGFIRPNYNPLEVADAPTAVTPTPGNTVASVDFTTPSNVGGAPVTDYYAVVQPGNITATSVTPPVAVTGLTIGTTYTTKVWANNSYGPSPYSPQSGGFVPVAASYVEDVFSTYLYTGNSSTQTITNGIDLDGEGGLVWIKSRSSAVEYHNLFDTVRGAANVIFSNVTDAAGNSPTRLSSFNASGFTVGSNSWVEVGELLSPKFLTKCLDSGDHYPEDKFSYIKQPYLESIRQMNTSYFSPNLASRVSDKIYLRRNSQSRIIEGSDDLESLMVKNGFDIISPERITIEEQIDIFRTAKIIVSVGGSVWANLIFANPNLIAVSLVSVASAPNDVHVQLSNLLGLNFHQVTCKKVSRIKGWNFSRIFYRDFAHSSFEIDNAALDDLEQLINAK